MEPISKYFFDDCFKRTYRDNDYSDIESDTADHLPFHFYSFMNVTDYKPMDELLIKECDGRISLAYERLPFIPNSIAEKFASTTHTLDISHNNIRDLSFLTNFEKLNTLILDKNMNLDIKSLPYLPCLSILWFNNCNILKLSEWMSQIQTSCPKLKQLSLLGNPGILSTFNGASVLEHNDYRMYVLSRLPTLQYLDDSIVTDLQRTKARENLHAYLNIGSSLKFVDKFGNSKRIPKFRHNSTKKFTNISSDSS